LGLAEEFREYYTYEDYKNWKGDWELIEGVPFAMSPSPTVKHQLVVSRIVYILNRELKKADCKGCLVLPEIDWIVKFNTVVRPDVAVVCDLKDFEGHLKVPPLLIFEVVSPSSSKRDEGLKFELYRQEGVKYYALVYPELKRLKVYRFKGSSVVLLEDKTSEKVEIPLKENCKLSISLEELFGEISPNE
jgi:Uma2 family endonuclease